MGPRRIRPIRFCATPFEEVHVPVTPIKRALVLVLLATLWAPLGCRPNSDKKSDGKPDNKTDGKPDSKTDNKADTTPVATLTAQELFAENKKDPNCLMTKYAGKVVDLTGVVSSAREETLILRAGDQPTEKVGCPVSEEDAKKPMLAGKMVRLRARIPTSPLDPVPMVWKIVSVGDASQGAPK
jgi:hypothetical protein